MAPVINKDIYILLLVGFNYNIKHKQTSVGDISGMAIPGLAQTTQVFTRGMTPLKIVYEISNHHDF